jgi:tRNA pseudouridine55 synthase
MISGVLNINKPSGITSYDVVRAVKRKLKTKKVGHCGTLDPMAQGVLVVCFGEMTKQFEALSGGRKVYDAEMLFGVKTDTGDKDGVVIAPAALQVPDAPSPEALQKALDSFRGEIEQCPPMYSAIKVKGKPLYQYAREGVTVERKLRNVTIYDITPGNYEYPRLSFTVTCSRGTYIRTLAEDIAGRFGQQAMLTALVRRQAGPFSLEGSIPLAAFNDMAFEEVMRIANETAGSLS